MLITSIEYESNLRYLHDLEKKLLNLVENWLSVERVAFSDDSSEKQVRTKIRI